MKTKTTFSKFIAFVVISLVLSVQAQAQVVLYGLTYGGGTYNQGTLFSVTPEGSLQTFASLNPTYAALPEGSLLYASNGNFYASSFCGGYADSCTIWCCSPFGVISTSINLDSVWGFSDPEGNSLIEAVDGNLYGMTTMGGTDGYGVLFKLSLSGQYSALHFFSGTDGGYPYGSLIQTSDGNLWGMTSEGGANSAGNIFYCSTSGTFSSVYSLVAATDGSNPDGDLLLANDGNFYGLTSLGGKYNYGTLFRYSPSGTFTKLVDFNDTNGGAPSGSLIQASDGKLYGLTARGGIVQSGGGYGTLFTCTLTGELTTLMQFNDSLNGANPEGTLMQASDGNLYGMTYDGGKYNAGTIFQYSLSHVYTKLYDFTGVDDGSYPMYGKMIEVDNIATGINKIANNGTAQLFPNPNNGQFSMKLAGINSVSVIEIYNTIGEKVYATTLSQTAKGSLTTLNIGSQPNGVYFYKVIDENRNNISTGKFVIER